MSLIKFFIVSYLWAVCTFPSAVAGSDVSSMSDLEAQILNDYRIIVQRQIADRSTCEPEDYKLFLVEFIEEARLQGLASRGTDILTVHVTKENWNMGALNLSNWGGDVLEVSPNSIDVGHLSYKEVIYYITNEFDPYKEPIEDLVLKIQEKFGILMQWNTASGAVNFSKRKNFFSFLNSFYSMALSKNMDRFTEKSLDVIVVAENWNGGSFHPANWGYDIRERSGFRIEVGDESEDALVEEIIKLQSPHNTAFTSSDRQGQLRLRAESTLDQ